MAMWRRFWIQLTADRRRFSVFCGTVGLGLLLWARIIVISNVPRTAIAEPDDTAIEDGSVPDAEASADKERPATTVTLFDRPDRDPFEVNSDVFPRPELAESFGRDQGKSVAQPAEDPQQAERRQMARYGAVVERLNLEAVMTGASMAVIDGYTRGLGDLVPGTGDDPLVFTLVEVRQRSVVLAIEGHFFELAMASPQG